MQLPLGTCVAVATAVLYSESMTFHREGLILPLVSPPAFLVWNSIVTFDDEVEYIYLDVRNNYGRNFKLLLTFAVCTTKVPPLKSQLSIPMSHSIWFHDEPSLLASFRR